jgi:hypothetical protein
MQQVDEPCACLPDARQAQKKREPASKKKVILYLLIMHACFIVWGKVYHELMPMSEYLSFDLMGLDPESRLGHAVSFFIYDVPKIFMLLGLITFSVGLFRTYISTERIKRFLQGKKEFVGNVFAAFLGIPTPFCTCSAVTLFTGFVSSGIPLGVTLSFLISAPMVNEVALVMLYGLVGWKVAALYLVVGLLIAIFAGWGIGRMGMEKDLQEWLKHAVREGDQEDECVDLIDRMKAGWKNMKEVMSAVWIYIVIGIAIGAGIHGYVPEEFIAGLMGEGAWLAVPASVAVGVPIYSNAAGVIPLVDAFLDKGAALGTVLAFMMSVTALSLPEILILRKVMKGRLLYTFVGTTALGILFTGFFFNLVL